MITVIRYMWYVLGYKEVYLYEVQSPCTTSYIHEMLRLEF